MFGKKPALSNKEGNIFLKVEMPHYACSSVVWSSVNFVTSKGNKLVSSFLKMFPLYIWQIWDV